MMPYLIFIAVPLLVLAGFLALVSFEERRGSRIILAGQRYRLDLTVARISFVVKHVDWGAFINDLVRTSVERATHDIAHMALVAVRALERQLTQVVRTLRARRDQPLLAPRADRPSRIQTAISYVKKTVQRSRKAPPVIQSEERAQ